MKDDDAICTVIWTVADVAKAYKEQYGREPTEKELDECLRKLNADALEDVCIERGWQVIAEAVQ